MKHRTEPENEMIRYLFGEMTEEEQIKFEDRFFEDTEFFLELEAVENELVDDYLLNILPAAERIRFQKGYLSTPKGREKLEFTQLLVNQALPELRKEKQVKATPVKILVPPAPLTPALDSPFFWVRFFEFLKIPELLVKQFAFSIGGTVIIAGTIWGYDQYLLKQKNEEIAALQQKEKDNLQRYNNLSSEKDNQIAKLQTDLQTAQQQSGSGKTEIIQRDVKGFEVPPYQGSRGSSSSVPELKLGISIKFILPTIRGNEADYPSYRLSLKSPDGKEFERSIPTSNTIKSQRLILVSLPPAYIKPGEYQAQLFGIDGDAVDIVSEYRFIISGR